MRERGGRTEEAGSGEKKVGGGNKRNTTQSALLAFLDDDVVPGFMIYKYWRVRDCEVCWENISEKLRAIVWLRSRGDFGNGRRGAHQDQGFSRLTLTTHST